MPYIAPVGIKSPHVSSSVSFLKVPVLKTQCDFVDGVVQSYNMADYLKREAVHVKDNCPLVAL